MSLEAVKVEGIPTLRLPDERVTAVHEAAYAVLHAAQGTSPFVVRIWPTRKGTGTTGRCDFPPGASELCIHALQQSYQTLARACVTLVCGAAEWRFEHNGFRLGEFAG